MKVSKLQRVEPGRTCQRLYINHIAAPHYHTRRNCFKPWDRDNIPPGSRVALVQYVTRNTVPVKVPALLSTPLQRFRLPSSPIPQAYVHFVGIDPAHRGVGLGSALYERFFGKVQSLGCRSVFAVTSPSNTGSIAFHERLGFEAVRSAGAPTSAIDGFVDCTIHGTFNGTISGNIDATVDCEIGGTINGSIDGRMKCSFDGIINMNSGTDGSVHGTTSSISSVSPAIDIRCNTNGTTCGSLDGTIDGTIDGSVDGSLEGAFDGTVDGTIVGLIDGIVRATMDGTMDGTIDATMDSTIDGTVDDAICGTSCGTSRGTDTSDVAHEKKTALKRAADGASNVADEYVHVGWDGPDGGDRVVFQKDF